MVIEKKSFLPNPVTRFCTSELKVKRIEAYARHHAGFKRWCNVIGIRYDEPRRAERIQVQCPGCFLACSRAGLHSILPLHEAWFIEADILAWWQAQDFDLALAAHEGNSDLCFLKGIKKIRAIMRDRPDLAAWWIDQERRKLGRTERTGFFRIDRADYASILKDLESDAPDGADFEYEDCACID